MHLLFPLLMTSIAMANDNGSAANDIGQWIGLIIVFLILTVLCMSGYGKSVRNLTIEDGEDPIIKRLDLLIHLARGIMMTTSLGIILGPMMVIFYLAIST